MHVAAAESVVFTTNGLRYENDTLGIENDADFSVPGTVQQNRSLSYITA